VLSSGDEPCDDIAMAFDIRHLAIYLHLARASELRQRMLVRDRLLVIAGSMSHAGALPRIAALCRTKILDHNANHMVRRWETFAAMSADDQFQPFLTQLQRKYPIEKAEQMLQSLGVQLANERDAYYSDEEYAASIWGLSLARLNELQPGDGDVEG
jgi:hypothetical protein